MICYPNKNPFPDPFDEPNEYWHMIKSCSTTSEDRKREQLESVGLSYDLEPVNGEQQA